LLKLDNLIDLLLLYHIEAVMAELDMPFVFIKDVLVLGKVAEDFFYFLIV